MAEGQGAGRHVYGHCKIFVALVLVVIYGHTGVCLTAVELKDGTSSLCLAEDNMPTLGERFAVCAFLRPSGTEGQRTQRQGVVGENEKRVDQEGNDTIFTLNQNGVIIRVSLASSHLKVQYNNSSYSSKDLLLPGLWRRLCVLRDPQKDRVVIYAHDRLSYASSSTDTQKASDGVEVPRGICLGSSSPGHKSFSGVIAAFAIQPWSVRPHQDSRLQPTDCSALEPSNALLTLGSTWVKNGGSVRILDYNATQFCAEAFTILSLKYFIGRRPQLQACESLNGRFPTEGEVKSAPAYYTRALRSSCITKGKFAAWIDMKTSHTTLQSPCLVLLMNGSLSNHTCVSELQCFLCLVPVALRYTMVGGIRAHDGTYALQATADKDLHLVGESSEIVREGDKWVLQSQLHSESWYLKGAILPVGRHTWRFHNENELLNVTVTSCNVEKEFTCNMGACIRRPQRCDGIKHCFDGSDEWRCEVLKMTGAYDKVTSPCGGKRRCAMMYGIFVHFIGDITTQDGLTTLDITLRLAWHDHRLGFHNLRSSEQNFDCDEIWRPSLIAMAGGQAEGQISDLVVYSATCGVNQNETNGHKYDPMDPMMDMYYSGSRNLLFYEINFKVTSPCNFKLERYPFGSHVCNVSFSFRERQRHMVFEERPMTLLNYTGSKDLLEFKLTKVTFETSQQTTESLRSSIILSLQLQTLYEFHVLNSFAPSALMFFIVLSTLFFPISDFNERIMVSLTALLVLAALFTQASSSSVKTPYYKLLDVWYAALILLCFTVVIINASVHSLRQRRGGPGKVSPMLGQIHFDLSDSSVRRAVICNLVSRITVIILFLSLVTLFILFSADLI